MIQKAVPQSLLCFLALAVTIGCSGVEQSPTATAETPGAETVVNSGSARVAHRDPQTGSLAPRASLDGLALSSEIERSRVDVDKRQAFVMPDGSRAVTRPLRPGTVLAATRDEQGRIRTSHVRNDGDATGKVEARHDR